MNILHINKFHYFRGGAEAVYLNTSRLLEANGHRSVFFSMHHPQNLPSETSDYFMPYAELDTHDNSLMSQLKTAGRILYSFKAKKLLSLLLDKHPVDIAHLHNIYHQISPSILHAFKKFNIPIVMTLHDYKMACASYHMLANGRICEACKGGKYYHCFLKKCVKDSKVKSLLNTIEMYVHHKIFHIYNLADVFISPSMFLKNKVEEMGFKGKIIYLPNFVNLEDYKPQYDWQENSIVYFGRLAKEKGLFTLIEAMKGLNTKLKIIGEGPLKESLELRVRSLGLENIKFTGYRAGEELRDEIKKSMFVVLPSEWYENNPRSIIEGFALGKPAIGARIGGIPELVKDNETGLTFEPWNADDLKRKISQLQENPSEISRMGKNARKMVDEELNPEVHYQKLMEIYKNCFK